MSAASIAALLAAAVVFFLVKPAYRATATLLIESKLQTVVEITEVSGRPSGDRIYFQTQVETIRSRPVVERVVDRLALDSHPVFDPRQQPPPRWKEWLTAYGIEFERDSKPQQTPQLIRSRVVEQVGRQLIVQAIGLSQLVQVSFDAPTPELAARVADAIAQTYIEHEFETRFSASRMAGTMLDGQIAELRIKLQASEQALQSYVESKGLLDRESARSGPALQLSELGRRIVEARERRVIAEQAWRQVSGREAANAPQVLANPAASEARASLAAAERDLALTAGSYGSAHPTYRDAFDRVEAARRVLQRIITSLAEGLRREYQSAVASEKALEDEEQIARRSIQGDNQLQIERETLERDVALNRSLYQTLLQRRKETETTGELQTAGARLIEPAVPPHLPVKPNRPLSVALAFMVGLFLAAGWVLLRSRLDKTVRRCDQIFDAFEQQMLAAIPEMPKHMLEKAGHAITAFPKTAFAEAIRDAAAGILLASIGQRGFMVMVTSSVPGEGKTTITTNLALSIATDTDKKVLLVDCDFRRPNVAKALGIDDRRPGLISILDGAIPFETAAMHSYGIYNLTVIPCGRVPSNPVIRLQEHRLGKMLAEWRERYDIILIDTPPVQLVSDALLISKYVDGAIYCIRGGKTPILLAKQGIERFKSASTKILGIALNFHDFQEADRYYGEHSAQSTYGHAYYGSNGDESESATRFG